MAKTTRPKARPKNIKAPLSKSLIPNTRSKSRETELSRGDVEFRADMEPQMWYNPIARLGYDPTKVKSMPQEIGPAAMYFPPKNTKEAVEKALTKEATRVDPTASGSKRIFPDDTVFFSGTAQSPIISHELTHRGLGQLIEYYKEDPEFFEKTYGELAAKKLEALDNPKDSFNRNEHITELFDDVNAALNIPSDSRVKSMADTRDTAFSSSQEEFQKDIAKKKPEDRWSHQERRYEAEVGLIKAAEDLLKQRGEPPKTEPDYPNFIEKTLGFRFAGGGLTMDEQMNKLFAEGGVNTGNSRVDPVSGNEVPPGSMPSEVRDDIDAKLSGGEYVVPADVLRYYGVAFFEKLRAKAKAGLQEMDADGRIGGGMPEEEDDFPFSVDELQTEEVGFAAGGMTTQAPMSSFNPSDWTLGSSFGGGAGMGQSEVRKFRDKDGNVVNVLFINGRPVVDVKALGYTEYVEETPAGTGEEVAAPEAPRESSRDRNPEPDNKPEPIDPAKNYYNISAEELLNPKYEEFGKNNLTKGLAALSPILGAGAGLIRNIKQAENLADARARALIAKERGFDTTALDAQIKKMEESASGFVNVVDLVGLDGTGIQKRHKNSAGNASTVAPSIQPRTSGSTSRATTGGGSSAATPSNSTQGESGADRAPIGDSWQANANGTGSVGTSRGVTSVRTGRDSEGGYAKSTTIGSAAPETSPRPASRPTNITGQPEVNEDAYTGTATNRVGPQARGGLINKPQKVAKPKTRRKTKI